MFLLALATAVPPCEYTQAQCWDLIDRSSAKQRLHKRSRLILHSILRGDHGIARRHFAVPEIDRIFDLTPDELNAVFRAEAPRLAGDALNRALVQANLQASDLDALVICTCTGYLCPGVTSYVAESLGFAPRRLSAGPSRTRLRCRYPFAARGQSCAGGAAIGQSGLHRRGGLFRCVLSGRRSRGPDQRLPLRGWRSRHDLAGDAGARPG